MTAMLHGSLVLIFIWLVVGGLGVPLPEDVAVGGAGVLVHRGAVDLPIAMTVIFVGALAGDALLFLVARRLGPSLYHRPAFRRMVPPHRRARIEDAYRCHGGRLVFFARNIPGLRAAVFAMASIQGMSLRRFLAYDALAVCVGIPLVVALGYFVSRHLVRIEQGLPSGRELALIAVALASLVYVAWRHLHVPPMQKPVTAAGSVP